MSSNSYTFKGTPGPYVAEKCDIVTEWVDCDGDRQVIAELHFDQETEAKLFAAAPELFEVCKELLKWHDKLADPQWKGSPTEQRARKALDKAVGEDQWEREDDNE